jgi:uncharacterized protein YjbJ (UPF0337 family)
MDPPDFLALWWWLSSSCCYSGGSSFLPVPLFAPSNGALLTVAQSLAGERNARRVPGRSSQISKAMDRPSNTVCAVSHRQYLHSRALSSSWFQAILPDISYTRGLNEKVLQLQLNQRHHEQRCPEANPRHGIANHEAPDAAACCACNAFHQRIRQQRKQIMSIPSTDQLKGIWKQQVGGVKLAWGKLTEDEILKSEGRAEKLAGLVQERYAITRDEADKQVKKFFDNAK